MLSDPDRLALLCMKVLLVEEEDHGDDEEEDLECDADLQVIFPANLNMRVQSH